MNSTILKPKKVNGAHREKRSAIDDAIAAAAELGTQADFKVPTGLWLHVDRWLDSPVWLRSGTSQPVGKALPPQIPLRDDLMIAANLLENAPIEDLVEWIVRNARPLAGPRASFLNASAPTLEHILSVASRACNAKNPLIEARLTSSPHQMIFESRARVDLGKIHDFLHLLALLYFYETIMILARDRAREIAIHVSCREAGVIQKLRSLMECRIFAAGKSNYIVIPANLVSIANPQYDPMLWQLALREAEAAEVMRHGSPIGRKIAEISAHLLATEHRAPLLKQLAIEVGISERTISRMLAAEGTSFRAIVEAERKNLAAELVNDRTLSLAIIAERLGFADVSSFGRSFRRWFGKTPGEYRS